jgi:Tfp pilus assembly protein PilF
VCSAVLSSPSGSSTPDDEDTRFEVTEAHDDQRELVGGAGRASRRHELDIEDEASITSRQAAQTGKRPHLVSMHTESAEPAPTVQPAGNDKNAVSKLSAKEVETISKNLYGNNQSFLNDREKRDMLRKVDAVHNSGHTPTGDPYKATAESSDQERPRMAKRTRGVAWFYRNWIQVVGQNDLHDQDEIIINDRPYLLRKKKFSPKFVIAALSPIAAVILFFVGSALTPSISGKGRVVGFVIDADGRPVIQPATIRIPDVGQTIKVNGQGFFVSDPVKSGSHKIECVINGAVVSADYATVVSGEITTVKMLPAATQPTSSDAVAQVEETIPQPEQPRIEPSYTERPTQNRPSAPSSPAGGSDTPVASDPNARLLLNADVDGATLSLNGRVIGAGNLTYSRLKPGHYNYEISKDGYKPVRGTIDLAAGRTTSLAAQLTPQKNTPAKPNLPAEEEHYQTAMAAMSVNDLTTAESEFSAAIDIRPSYAPAYMGLGETKSKSGRNVDASADYLRAAEIYRVGGDLGKALIAYNSSVRTDKTSSVALIGRGNLYLARNEQIAAIADYEQVISMDKRNYDAYYGLGMARYAQGNPKQAVKHFKDARSLQPKNPDVHQYLMLCYFGTDDIKEAKKSYDDFVSVANDAQLKQLRSNPKFGAVLRVVQVQ